MVLSKFLMYLVFTAVFFGDSKFVAHMGAVGRYLGWFPELLSSAILLVVLGQVIITKKVYIHPKYIILGILITLHLFGGAIINLEQPGAVFAGIRAYFKWIPIFLLPMAYSFSQRDIRDLCKFVLGLSLLQLPLALYQRIIEFPFSSFKTGDVVRGTLTDSGDLSLYLISVIAMLTAFYVRKRIGMKIFAWLLLCLFIPTTINETKSTLILLPLALLIPMLSDREQSSYNRVRQLVGVSIVGVMLFSIFVTIYNAHWGEKDSIIDKLFENGGIVQKLYHKDKMYSADEVGKGYDIGRIDSIVIALHELSRDPVHLVAGLGMGNVGPHFSNVIEGAYSEKYARWGVQNTNITYLLWETGVLGVIFIVIFLFFLFRDARMVMARDDFAGVMGLGWSAVVVIIGAGMFYKTFVEQNTVSYSFWFFSGYIVAERIRGQIANMGSQKQEQPGSGMKSESGRVPSGI